MSYRTKNSKATLMNGEQEKDTISLPLCLLFYYTYVSVGTMETPQKYSTPMKNKP